MLVTLRFKGLTLSCLFNALCLLICLFSCLFVVIQSCLVAVVVPEKDPVEKWAEKNGVDGDMDSFCANEVICAFCLLIASKRASSLWREISLVILYQLETFGNMYFPAGIILNFFCNPYLAMTTTRRVVSHCLEGTGMRDLG